MKLTKTDLVLTLKQSHWLKPYISFNTARIKKESRKNFDKKLLKDFFKLMNNSLYDKTMENFRNRVAEKLVTNA